MTALSMKNVRDLIQITKDYKMVILLHERRMIFFFLWAKNCRFRFEKGSLMGKLEPASWRSKPASLLESWAGEGGLNLSQMHLSGIHPELNLLTQTLTQLAISRPPFWGRGSWQWARRIGPFKRGSTQSSFSWSSQSDKSHFAWGKGRGNRDYIVLGSRSSLPSVEMGRKKKKGINIPS